MHRSWLLHTSLLLPFIGWSIILWLSLIASAHCQQQQQYPQQRLDRVSITRPFCLSTDINSTSSYSGTEVISWTSPEAQLLKYGCGPATFDFDPTNTNEEQCVYSYYSNSDRLVGGPEICKPERPVRIDQLLAHKATFCRWKWTPKAGSGGTIGCLVDMRCNATVTTGMAAGGETKVLLLTEKQCGDPGTYIRLVPLALARRRNYAILDQQQKWHDLAYDPIGEKSYAVNAPEAQITAILSYNDNGQLPDNVKRLQTVLSCDHGVSCPILIPKDSLVGSNGVVSGGGSVRGSLAYTMHLGRATHLLFSDVNMGSASNGKPQFLRALLFADLNKKSHSIVATIGPIGASAFSVAAVMSFSVSAERVAVYIARGHNILHATLEVNTSSGLFKSDPRCEPVIAECLDVTDRMPGLKEVGFTGSRTKNVDGLLDGNAATNVMVSASMVGVGTIAEMVARVVFFTTVDGALRKIVGLEGTGGRLATGFAKTITYSLDTGPLPAGFLPTHLHALPFILDPSSSSVGGNVAVDILFILGNVTSSAENRVMNLRIPAEEVLLRADENQDGPQVLASSVAVPISVLEQTPLDTFTSVMRDNNGIIYVGNNGPIAARAAYCCWLGGPYPQDAAASTMFVPGIGKSLKSLGQQRISFEDAPQASDVTALLYVPKRRVVFADTRGFYRSTGLPCDALFIGRTHNILFTSWNCMRAEDNALLSLRNGATMRTEVYLGSSASGAANTAGNERFMDNDVFLPFYARRAMFSEDLFSGFTAFPATNSRQPLTDPDVTIGYFIVQSKEDIRYIGLPPGYGSSPTRSASTVVAASTQMYTMASYVDASLFQPRTLSQKLQMFVSSGMENLTLYGVAPTAEEKKLWDDAQGVIFLAAYTGHSILVAIPVRETEDLHVENRFNTAKSSRFHNVQTVVGKWGVPKNVDGLAHENAHLNTPLSVAYAAAGNFLLIGCLRDSREGGGIALRKVTNVLPLTEYGDLSDPDFRPVKSFLNIDNRATNRVVSTISLSGTLLDNQVLYRPDLKEPFLYQFLLHPSFSSSHNADLYISVGNRGIFRVKNTTETTMQVEQVVATYHPKGLSLDSVTGELFYTSGDTWGSRVQTGSWCCAAKTSDSLQSEEETSTKWRLNAVNTSVNYDIYDRLLQQPESIRGSVSLLPELTGSDVIQGSSSLATTPVLPPYAGPLGLVEGEIEAELQLQQEVANGTFPNRKFLYIADTVALLKRFNLQTMKVELVPLEPPGHGASPETNNMVSLMPIYNVSAARYLRSDEIYEEPEWLGFIGVRTQSEVILIQLPCEETIGARVAAFPTQREAYMEHPRCNEKFAVTQVTDRLKTGSDVQVRGSAFWQPYMVPRNPTLGDSPAAATMRRPLEDFMNETLNTTVGVLYTIISSHYCVVRHTIHSVITTEGIVKFSAQPAFDSNKDSHQNRLIGSCSTTRPTSPKYGNAMGCQLVMPQELAVTACGLALFITDGRGQLTKLQNLLPIFGEHANNRMLFPMSGHAFQHPDSRDNDRITQYIHGADSIVMHPLFNTQADVLVYFGPRRTNEEDAHPINGKFRRVVSFFHQQLPDHPTMLPKLYKDNNYTYGNSQKWWIASVGTMAAAASSDALGLDFFGPILRGDYNTKASGAVFDFYNVLSNFDVGRIKGLHQFTVHRSYNGSGLARDIYGGSGWMNESHDGNPNGNGDAESKTRSRSAGSVTPTKEPSATWSKSLSEGKKRPTPTPTQAGTLTNNPHTPTLTAAATLTLIVDTEPTRQPPPPPDAPQTPAPSSPPSSTETRSSVALSIVLPNKEAATAVTSSSASVSAVGSAMSPTVATNWVRVSGFVGSVNCEFSEDDTEPSIFEHPISFSLGGSVLSRFMGAAVVTSVCFVMLPTATLLALFIKRKRHNQDQRSASSLEDAMMLTVGDGESNSNSNSSDSSSSSTSGNTATTADQETSNSVLVVKVLGIFATISLGFFYPTGMGVCVLLVAHPTQSGGVSGVALGLVLGILNTICCGLYAWVAVNNGSFMKYVKMLDAPTIRAQQLATRRRQRQQEEGSDDRSSSSSSSDDDGHAQDTDAIVFVNAEAAIPFVESFGPSFDCCEGKATLLLNRVCFFEDVAVSTIIVMLSSVRPESGNCKPIAGFMIVVALLHCVYLGYTRPYGSNVDLSFSGLHAVLQLGIAIGCLLTISNGDLMEYVAYMVLIDASLFFIQTIVLGVQAYIRSQRKQALLMLSSGADDAQPTPQESPPPTKRNTRHKRPTRSAHKQHTEASESSRISSSSSSSSEGDDLDDGALEEPLLSVPTEASTHGATANSASSNTISNSTRRTKFNPLAHPAETTP